LLASAALIAVSSTTFNTAHSLSTLDATMPPLPEWPTFGMVEDMRPAMFAALVAGEPTVLATLHTVRGGGPRAPGAQMLISRRAASGFLSGGCVEDDIAIHANLAIDDGEARHLVYGEGSPWPDIRLPCSARIEVLVERVTPDDPALTALLATTEARRPLLWITDGVARRIDATFNRRPPDCTVRSEPFEVRRLYEPIPRLVVIGGNPVALAVASLGAQSGFETTLIRPKGPADPPPLAGVAYSRGDCREVLEDLVPDDWTAMAVATHDWDTDHEALLTALRSRAGYIGVLGARRRLPERLARLRAAGVDDVAIKRLRAPIGLDLGGKAPWDVAVSVIAQIIGLRHGKAPAADSGCTCAEASVTSDGLGSQRTRKYR
jgi:xanthine dehydrogenase accessory factor